MTLDDLLKDLIDTAIKAVTAAGAKAPGTLRGLAACKGKSFPELTALLAEAKKRRKQAGESASEEQQAFEIAVWRVWLIAKAYNELNLSDYSDARR